MMNNPINKLASINGINLRNSLILTALLLTVCNSVSAQPSSKLSFHKGFHLLTIDKDQAIEYLTESINLDSSNAEAYYYRGIINYKKGNFINSIEDFENARLLDSALTITHIYKGFAYRGLGEIDKAISEFSTYLTKNPEDTSAYSYILRGKLKQRLGDNMGAEQDYDLAVALKPIEEKYYFYRFNSKFEREDYKGALKEISEVIKLNPDFYGYHFYRGNTFFNLENYEEAIDNYNTSIDLYNYNADAYYQRGEVYQALKNHHEAIESYSMAIMMNPNDGAFYSRRGNSKYSNGDKSGACLDWELAESKGYYEDYDKMKKLCE